MTLAHQDIVEIQQVQALYGHAVDWPDQSLLAKVFTQDAVFDGRPCGGNDLYEGLAAIAAWFGLGKPPHPNVHHMMNVWVYEEGGRVRVKAKWLVRNPKDGNIYLGDYDDVMQRTPDGWRIQHRIVTTRDPGKSFV
jgi:ketosteroid isomerase-like protein